MFAKSGGAPPPYRSRSMHLKVHSLPIAFNHRIQQHHVPNNHTPKISIFKDSATQKTIVNFEFELPRTERTERTLSDYRTIVTELLSTSEITTSVLNRQVLLEALSCSYPFSDSFSESSLGNILVHVNGISLSPRPICRIRVRNGSSAPSA